MGDGVLSASDKRLCRRRWVYNIPASVVILFLSGMPFAFAVFGIEIADRGRHLVESFEGGLGVRSFTCAIAVIAGALLLDWEPDRMRTGAVIGVLLSAFQLLIAYGIRLGSPWLLLLGNAIWGLGNGMLYIIGVIHVAAWLPERPNLVMAINFGALGFGSIVGARMFFLLVGVLGVVNALYVTGVVTCLFLAVAVLGLTMPPLSWDPRSASEIRLSTIGVQYGTKLGRRIFRHAQIYALVFIVAASTGPVFGFYTAFCNLFVEMYGSSANTVSWWFAIMNTIAFLSRFAGGFLVRYAGIGHGIMALGSKNLSIVVLVAQTVASWHLQWSPQPTMEMFLVCVGVIFLTFSSSSTLSAVLARNVFAPVNRGLVFALCMASTGLSTMFFSVLLSTPSCSLHDYMTICTVVSALGACACLFITPCKAALSADTTSYGTYGAV